MPTEPDPAKDGAGEMAGERLERLGGLGRALDVGAAMGVQGLSSRHDDGEHDEIGECHADENVQPAGRLLASRAFRGLVFERLCLRAAFGFLAHLFEAVSALPKEEVGRDGCAQYRDQQGEIGLVELDMGDDGVGENAAPLMGDEDRHDEIGQQRGAEHLEGQRDAGEVAQNQQRGDEDARQERPEPGRSGMEQLHP